MNISILDGIVIGGVGGACAGLSVWGIQLWHTWKREKRDKRRVHKWLCENTAKKAGEQFRSTRAIASWTNLTEDRVRYVCSVHPSIFLSTEDREDMWGLFGRTSRSIWEEPGATL